ncbi:7-deoxyloganetin glucosyltransferase-like [Hordeum vulgare]|uniref:Glycosyltransferase n=1 Tax=Hordeum vulgare subsp. vulgare TaxID=112509 RepID=A0A287UTI4_HORVV|nr:7-deoxyloganetin glucosyltransferase-like [Hordeum vulgare subsp. vulgare]KAE8771853.1 7-deoxyloganetin glucosyltransferase-like [Hordeum vulgare]
MSSAAHQRQPHAVLIPQPAQGHVTPMLHLAKALHARGFRITFVNSEYNRRRLLRSRGPGSLDGADGFRFEAVPDGLPPPSDDHGDDVTQDIAALCLSTTKHSAAPFRELLVRLNNGMPGAPPVSCVIADGVMSFAQRVAGEMGIPALVFWTTSACGFMGYLHFAELVRRGYVPLKDESDLTNGYLDTVIDWIPGMEGIRLKDIPSFIRTTDPDDVMLNFDGGEAQNARGARGLILNTYDELEQDVVDALRRTFPRLYTVGPLPAFAKAAAGGAELDAIGGNLWEEDASCLRWLDAQKQPGSVVYVNFGSITVVTTAQLTEFAWGLASCGRPFLWVVRPDLVAGEKAVLPEEFVRDTKDRGVLASWCPQERVLSHPSVGLFLTHCGWNSTLESVCAGVPMVCWPFFAEQPTNCRYACAKWGIGMEIGGDVNREEVARLVREAMDGEKGEAMRASATAWKESARAATEGGGSSSENMDRLVKFLRAGCDGAS